MAATPPAFDRYIEPFAGSGCLFFGLRPRSALLSDFNAELIDAYVTIRSHPRLVARETNRFPTDHDAYYTVRAMDPDLLDPVSRTARFTYLNRFSFNGVYRTNKQGQFNVPRGRDTGRIPQEREFYRCAVALRTAELVACDFEETCDRALTGDFVYLDPPYATSRPNHGEYGYGAFATADEARLFEVLHQLDRRGVQFLLSYGGSPPTADIPKRWQSVSLFSTRTVGGRTERRSATPEFLLANYELPAVTS